MRSHRATATRLALLGAAVAAAAAGPCDVFAAAGTPCVAAHALTRALSASYYGLLYTVRRAVDNATLDVAPVAAGGVANVSAHDAFCAARDCVVLRIWDQSGRGNHLDVGPGGGAAPKPDRPVNASALPITLRGARAYGAYFGGGQGYRIDVTSGVARGNEPETLYMVTSGTHVNNGCCFDYGCGRRGVGGRDGGWAGRACSRWGGGRRQTTTPWSWGRRQGVRLVRAAGSGRPAVSGCRCPLLLGPIARPAQKRGERQPR